MNQWVPAPGLPGAGWYDAGGIAERHVERIVTERLAAVLALADQWEDEPYTVPWHARQLRAVVAADPADTSR